MPYECVGSGTLVVGDEAVGFADGTVDMELARPPSKAICYVELADIRIKLSGDAPAPGRGGGRLKVNGSDFTVDSARDITNFRAIRNASTDALINYDLLRES